MAYGGGTFSPIVGSAQAFTYTFLGNEGTHFTVNLPSTRQSTSYAVTFGPRTEPDTFTFSWDTPTTTTFKLRTSSQVPAGRQLSIVVNDLTA